VADFPTYTGGVERPFCAWVVGQTDEYANEPEVLALFEKDYPRKNPFEDLIDIRLCDPGDDGYFRSPCDIAPTPGRVNNGNGVCADIGSAKAKKWKTRYPAFESVAIFLTRKPTEEEFKLLLDRANRFHEVPKKHEWDSRPQVLRCRLVREVTRVEYVLGCP
jgi:hypothetical protein